MPVGRFVIAPQGPGTIIEGPISWDPERLYNPIGPNPSVRLEAVAVTLTQTYGGTRDATVYRDVANTDAQLMREGDALDCGWAYPEPEGP